MVTSCKIFVHTSIIHCKFILVSSCPFLCANSFIEFINIYAGIGWKKADFSAQRHSKCFNSIMGSYYISWRPSWHSSAGWTKNLSWAYRNAFINNNYYWVGTLTQFLMQWIFLYICHVMCFVMSEFHHCRCLALLECWGSLVHFFMCFLLCAVLWSGEAF